MRLKQFIGFIVLTALLVSCATPPKLSETKISPDDTPSLTLARQTSVVCLEPIVAKQKVSPTFKYGCFCGRNHPNIRLAGTTSEINLSVEQRYQLIERYLAIRPVDSIDLACQSHDVCWILNGRPELACNEEFRDTLTVLRSKWKGRIGWGDTNSLEWRCSKIALDMSFATNAMMEGVSNISGIEAGQNFAQLISLPVSAIYALMTTFSGVFDSYPKSGEKCD
jgi:hypothetical protein